MANISMHPIRAHPGMLRLAMLPELFQTCLGAWSDWRARTQERQIMRLRDMQRDSAKAPVPHWQLQGWR